MAAPVVVTRRGPRTRVIVVLCAIILAILLGAAFWVGVRAVLAKAEFERLVPLVAEVQAAGASGDLARVDGALDGIAEHAHAAATLTGDPVWAVAEAMPEYGANFTAVRVIAARLDDVAEAAAAVLAAANAPAQGEGTGRMDPALLERAAGPLAEASAALVRAQTELAALQRAELLPPLASAIGSLAPAVTEAARLSEGVADAALALPAIAGADGPRTLLVMVQNNAELRTGGGITGSFALLSADRGAFTLVAQADSSQFASRSEPIGPLPASAVAHYGDVIGQWVQNASSTADFSVTAELAVAWWQSRTGASPDAVMSIDAAVAQSVLGALGPVALPDGTQLDAGNVVQRLLVDPYTTLDSDAQTTFQQATTAAILDRLLLGGADPLLALGSLAGPIADGHVALWSARAEDQDTLARSMLGGALARHRLADEGTYAVYFNDVTGGKMDLFLDTRIDVGIRDCRADGRPEVSVTLTMRSTAPTDIGSLPISVTGGGLWGTAVGDIGTLVSVAAPPGAFYGGVSKNGEPEMSVDESDSGFPMSTARVNLSPSEENTLSFRFIAAEPGAVAPAILHTPMLTDPPVTVADLPCE